VTDAVTRLNAALEGRYAIERELGRGGMATVYLAQDIRHDRQVAIKVLKPELAAVLGAERFLTEIKTTAGLQHPHILPLFDSGEADGFLFYVMPFIDGETLRGKLDRETQLGIDDAVRITRDVADALSYAHRNGIIHRDVKPENILLHDGRPTVADFGIALAVSAAGGGRMTETGLSLGTPYYMSPEQATAEKDLTYRTDIYALGCVLYEMLTGDPPHTGSSSQQIVMKIVTDDARPVQELRKSVPPNVAAALQKALEKLPADRFESAEAFAGALADPAFTVGAGLPGVVAGQRAKPSPLVTAAAYLAPLLFVAALWGWLRPDDRGTVDVPVVDARLYSGPDVTMRTGVGLALSPSGDRLAFVGHDSTGTPSLWIRLLESEEVLRVPGTLNASWPFWSPDGESLAFTAAGRIRTVDLASGSSRALCETDVAGRGAWSSDGVILFENESVLYRAEVGGRECRPVTRLEDSEGYHSRPSFLPGGKRFVFTTGAKGAHIGDLDTGDRQLLVEGAWTTQFVAPDWILYTETPVGGLDARGQLPLLAQRIDLNTMAMVGEPVSVFNGIRTPGGIASFSAASNGLLVAVRAPTTRNPLVWVTREGTMTDPIPMPSDPFSYAPSHDGTRIAMAGWGFWIHDLRRGISEEMFAETRKTRIEWLPAWSPGDSLLAYSALLDGPAGAYLYHIREGSLSTLFEVGEDQIGRLAWSPNGDEIAFRLLTTDPLTTGVWVYSLATDERRLLFAARDENQIRSSLEFSPDGRWLLYSSNETGGKEVYLRSYPGLDAPRRVSSGGGSQAHWARDGKTIFYRSSADQVMSVSVTDSDEGSLGVPRMVLDSDRTTEFWGVSPDGLRFLRLLRSRDSRVPELHLITAWQARAAQTADGNEGGNR
jgi:eukaryotic-like serine/threonine-protein kinase